MIRIYIFDDTLKMGNYSKPHCDRIFIMTGRMFTKNSASVVTQWRKIYTFCIHFVSRII